MTVSDMNIASLLDVFDYALVLIYGLALDVFISGGCDTPRQKRLIAYLCPCFLVVQLLGWLALGELAVKQIYPLIVHLPLVLILVLALKKPWGIAIVSTATAYLCCQPPRWGSMAVEALTHSAVAGNLVYIVLLSGSFYLFRRYFVAAAYGAMTSSPTALLLFGSLPCSYYIFDYATTIYSDALYSGIQALNEFLPTVLVVFYVLFLPAFHVQSQKRSSAEMQRSLLEVELKQSQQEMDSLRQSEMQTAVYQHDMRHHLNMISGLLASGSPPASSGVHPKGPVRRGGHHLPPLLRERDGESAVLLLRPEGGKIRRYSERGRAGPRPPAHQRHGAVLPAVQRAGKCPARRVHAAAGVPPDGRPLLRHPPEQTAHRGAQSLRHAAGDAGWRTGIRCGGPRLRLPQHPGHCPAARRSVPVPGGAGHIPAARDAAGKGRRQVNLRPVKKDLHLAVQVLFYWFVQPSMISWKYRAFMPVPSSIATITVWPSLSMKVPA